MLSIHHSNNTKTPDPAIQQFHSSLKNIRQISSSSLIHPISKQQFFSSNEIYNNNKEDNQSIYNNINTRLLMNNVGENEIHFFSSSVPKDKKSIIANMHYAIDAKPYKRKKNKKKKKKSNHHINIFGIENIPQNRYYIEKERKKRERKNRFEGLIVIKKLTQDNIIEVQSLYDGMNPKMKLQLNMMKENMKKTNNQNVNNNNINSISSSRKNRFAYYSSKHNPNNLLNNKSLSNIKTNNPLIKSLPIENKHKPKFNNHNYYTSSKPCLTYEHSSRSSLDIIQHKHILKTAVYKYENDIRKRGLTLHNIQTIFPFNKNISTQKQTTLKQSSSCGNYTRYQTAKTKLHNNSAVFINKQNSFINNSPSHKSIHNNRYSTINKPFKPKTKTSPQPQETTSVIQTRKEIAEKQSINYKDFKSLLYCIVPGNASYLVKNCMCHRINWKETFSSSSSLFNFKWQQLSHGIDFGSLSHIAYLRQIVNHYEYHTLISHKGNLFANIFKWCEDRNIPVFKYVPFTIVHKIIRDDKENINKLKQERLEEFITSNIERYVKKYEHIGIIRDYDPIETYADIFPWLLPSNKGKEDKGEEGYRNKKEKNLNEEEGIVGKNTRIEIPTTHWCGKNMWVVKAANLNRGQCIRVVDNYQKMEKVIKMIQEGVEKDFTVADIEEEEDDISKKGSNNNNSVSPNSKEKENEKKKYSSNKIIIQKYIESPLLYKGRKCDMRIWVLITHKMRVYVFKEGHLKTCSVDYNINSQDAFTHITNYSFQKYSDNFAKFEIGNEVPFHDFQTFIDEQYPKRKYTIKDNLMNQVKEIVAISMKCAKAQINLHKRKYSFEIFGYDFMLDSDFNLFLIEINTNPGLEESSPWIRKIVPRMLDDALRLTIDVLFNTKYNHSLNYKKDEGECNEKGKGGLTEKIIENESKEKENEDECKEEEKESDNGKVNKEQEQEIQEIPNSKEQEEKSNKDENGNEDEKKYVSPFGIPGYSNDENLWEFVCDLNDKDEFELLQEEIEREKMVKKEKEREAFYTGIKHLMQKRNTRKSKSGNLNNE